MTRTIALHGNPGTGADFERLAQHLALPGGALVTPTRPRAGADLAGLRATIERLVDERRGEPYALLGYSWGCYLALQHARAAARPPVALVLLNPYLRSAEPLSPFVRLLLSIPVLGGALLRRTAPRQTAAFVTRVFEPVDAPADLRAEMSARLGEPALWRGALRYKELMQREPLPPLERLPCRALVLIGSDDVVSRWEHQRAPLGAVTEDIDVHEVAGAGHSLLWTCQDAVVPLVRDWLTH